MLLKSLTYVVMTSAGGGVCGGVSATLLSRARLGLLLSLQGAPGHWPHLAAATGVLGGTLVGFGYGLGAVRQASGKTLFTVAPRVPPAVTPAVTPSQSLAPPC